ncbi:MAG: ABC transporter ATP-binding protein [Planctomycetota bacterium]|jgi:iron complex transport system ATP-binding protein
MVNALHATGLSFDHPGPIRAVDGVDLDLDERELLVVIGPNGSGKSTLLRLLAGLLEPRTGEVMVKGRALGSLSISERARLLAVVPQSLATLPEVTVERFVMSGRYARIGRWRGAQADDADAVSRALSSADVDGLGQRHLPDLSGGQRQSVLIARALAQQAEILLVDEPTASLDLNHQLSVFALLGRLSDAGRCAIVVTHDLNLASQFADRVALMDRGRLTAVGPPDEVLRPEVLAPVYGSELHYGRMPPPDDRPFVLPWRATENGP